MSDEANTRTIVRRIDPDVIERIANHRTKFRMERDAARTENVRLKAENDQLKAEHADLTVRADTSASARKVQELEGRLRELDHRKVFDKVAKAKGVPEDSLDLVYQNSGYKVDQPMPDEVAIGAILDETKAKPGVGRLFGDPAPSTNGVTPQTAPIRPAVGSGQGGSGQGRIPMAPDDPRHGDVRYIMENFDTISADARGRLERGEI